MIFSRLYVWRTSFLTRRSLSSCGSGHLLHVREDLKRTLWPTILCRPECNRTFSISNNYQATHRNLSKADQLARSRPRLMKEYAMESKKDNMPDGWDLIFTSKQHKTVLLVAHFVSLVCLCAVPFLQVYYWLEMVHEDDVTFATVSITKRTEVTLFVLMNAFFMTIIMKNVRSVPKRIYFNENTGNYVAFCRSWWPWSTVRKQFKAEDIRPLPFRLIPAQFRFFKHNDYIVSNRRLIFPHSAFRSGEDRHLLLRFVE